MLGIELNRNHELQLWRQIYQYLKELMLSGHLKAGEALPSTRELAKDLKVSRNTVCEAYDLLIAEGFIISRQGAPTRVSEGLCLEPVKPASTPKLKSKAVRSISVSFRTGRPDLKQFPRFLWQQLLHKASEELPLEDFGYTGPQGLPDLREEITAWLFRSRGLKVSAEDIFITAGATQGLHLIADILCGKGQKILMEDPCHLGMLGTFLNKGCSIIPIPVDAEGMQTDYLSKCGSTGPIYVTPSHQFPLGGILPASRRTALIRFAREKDLYIIEDDYDSEFRYSGEPIAPLYTLDPQRVIYVGTFSKAVFPALRIGYVILPYQLQEHWRNLRTYTDVQNPPFEQAALAEFLRTRKLDRHVQKMRKIYGLRRQVLLDSLAEAFSSEWIAYGDSAGLHVAIDFPGRRFDEGFKSSCLKNGVYITPVESHCLEKGRHQSKLLMGYGHLEPDVIRKGVSLLSHIIKK
ncbi:PLP-dependent aminotransferase family protein [Desulfosporosinus meridiei]|uniref:Transcriptional regulator with HTH domain and aminotransferase domain n=1 Tax=Desulfosporosinus meridiei (strain ATCC BAA-275 / DSM 13257 / KCTC 12902 / NCIMB 13706 / S10) TaxID=768704 RepID=J7IUJ0_DESMD|nr:PLP-dependent aminotransferase family protein [Desulfosporosinus meridiei]AFQ43809.1 transcriptional regulator with HTH domain and aminotransferase domain [Desulfosporosinus meridiei DSM 13257]